MSTKERYGNAVYQASWEILQTGRRSVTVGEVAKLAGVSKPTARKYLRLMENEAMFYREYYDGIGEYSTVYRANLGVWGLDDKHGF